MTEHTPDTPLPNWIDDTTGVAYVTKDEYESKYIFAITDSSFDEGWV